MEQSLSLYVSLCPCVTMYVQFSHKLLYDKKFLIRKNVDEFLVIYQNFSLPLAIGNVAIVLSLFYLSNFPQCRFLSIFSCQKFAL